MSDLAAAIEKVAAANPLLVACDYDGTLAAIVDDPAAAAPHPAAMHALRSLAPLDGVHVAIVSGRMQRDLVTLTGAPDGVTLIGSHGAETTSGPVVGPHARRSLDLVTDAFGELAARYPGSRVETKPAGVAFHYRTVAEDDRAAASAAAIDIASRSDELRVMHGKMVVELAASPSHKGDAVSRLRTKTGANAVVFIGDDVTDEDAFRALVSGDIGIKVGPGPTSALHRIDDQDAVASVLDALVTLRTPPPASDQA